MQPGGEEWSAVGRLSWGRAAKRGLQVGMVNYMVCSLEVGTEQRNLSWGPQRYPATMVENQAEREEGVGGSCEKGWSEQWRTAGVISRKQRGRAFPEEGSGP